MSPIGENTKLDELASWNNLPLELQNLVIIQVADMDQFSDHIELKAELVLKPRSGATAAELLPFIQELNQYKLVNKSFNTAISFVLKNLNERVNNLRLIKFLTQRYYVYNEAYENGLSETNNSRLPYPDPKGPPQLLDALFSGCELPFARSSLKYFTEEVEADIIDLIKLMPESINCSLGKLKNAYEIPPLYAAIINTAVPEYIIELMFEYGADANSTFKVDSGQERKIYLEINNFNGYGPRAQAIQALFVKYGYVDS